MKVDQRPMPSFFRTTGEVFTRKGGSTLLAPVLVVGFSARDMDFNRVGAGLRPLDPNKVWVCGFDLLVVTAYLPGSSTLGNSRSMALVLIVGSSLEKFDSLMTVRSSMAPSVFSPVTIAHRSAVLSPVKSAKE